MKYFKNSEHGQGLVEYALILVIVSIIVIAALMIAEPIANRISYDFNGSNADLLSDAPVIAESGHPVHIDYRRVSDLNYSIKYLSYSCTIVYVGNSYVKVGTPYKDPSVVSINRVDKSHYQICNTEPGADIALYMTLIDQPR